MLHNCKKESKKGLLRDFEEKLTLDWVFPCVLLQFQGFTFDELEQESESKNILIRIEMIRIGIAF